MGYDYKTERPALFTEDGQVMFLKVRDTVQKHLKESGALDISTAISGVCGSSWTQLACVDRLEELGEVKIIRLDDRWTQGHIIVPAKGVRD